MENRWRVNEYFSSTDLVEYGIFHTERLSPINRNGYMPQRCHFVTVATHFYGIFKKRDYLRVPCFTCGGGHEDADGYYRRYRRRFEAKLLARYPLLSLRCARQIAAEFEGTLETYNADFMCEISGPDDLEFATEHNFKIRNMQPISYEVSEGVKARPASKSSVSELLDAKDDDRLEEGDDWLGECVICMDEMETKKDAIKMPCSHSFHRDCLVEWLNNSHVCPLCRYEMPSKPEPEPEPE